MAAKAATHGTWTLRMLGRFGATTARGSSRHSLPVGKTEPRANFGTKGLLPWVAAVRTKRGYAAGAAMTF